MPAECEATLSVSRAHRQRANLTEQSAAREPGVRGLSPNGDATLACLDSLDKTRLKPRAHEVRYRVTVTVTFS